MKTGYSKIEDSLWLIKRLKETLKGRISTTYVIASGILTGKYIIGDTWVESSEIDFTIEYNKDEFLRINVGQHQQDESYTKKITALKALGEAIINVDINEQIKIGEPLVFYTANYINSGETPHLEWAFSNKEEYIEKLYEDSSIENILIIDKDIRELQKKSVVERFDSIPSDLNWLGYKLKEKLGKKFWYSDELRSIFPSILIGHYGSAWNSIAFEIEYNASEFLRIKVGTVVNSTSEEKIEALKSFAETVINIKTKEGKTIGQPLTFYTTLENSQKQPCLEWVFYKKEDYISELKNGTLYNDDNTIEDLMFIDKSLEIPKIEDKTRKIGTIKKQP